MNIATFQVFSPYPYIVTIGELTIHLISRRVTLEGELLELSPEEYRFLRYLALRNGVPISRETLVDHMSPPGKKFTGNFVSMYVSRLRTKIGEQYLPLARLKENANQFRLIAP